MAETWQGDSGAAPRRGIGRGLAAILRPSDRETEGLRELAIELIRPNPRQPRREFEREALLALSESIKARGILQPIVVRPIAGRRLRADRRRAPPARGGDGGPRRGARHRPRRRGGRAARARADRERRARGPEPGRGGACVRDPRRRPRRNQGGAGPPDRQEPRGGLEPDPPARPARRGARRQIETGELSEGHGRAMLIARAGRRARLARKAIEKGWSVRETERRAREAASPERRPPCAPRCPPPGPRGLDRPAEDALTSALGREVRVRRAAARPGRDRLRRPAARSCSPSGSPTRCGMTARHRAWDRCCAALDSAL